MSHTTRIVARRMASGLRSTKFFANRAGRPWKDANTFRRAFNRLGAKLVLAHPSFATRYYVGLIEGEPLAVPTAELTIRTMRHTCVTLNFDAGVPPDRRDYRPQPRRDQRYSGPLPRQHRRPSRRRARRPAGA